MRNVHNEAWDKTQTINDILFIDEWTVRMNKSDSEDISASLCQSEAKQLNITIINDSICVQQHKKWNYEDHIIFCKLWISLKDMKTVTDTFNQKSMSHDWCHRAKTTSQRSEQAVTDIMRKINYDEII